MMTNNFVKLKIRLLETSALSSVIGDIFFLFFTSFSLSKYKSKRKAFISPSPSHFPFNSHSLQNHSFQFDCDDDKHPFNIFAIYFYLSSQLNDLTRAQYWMTYWKKWTEVIEKSLLIVLFHFSFSIWTRGREGTCQTTFEYFIYGRMRTLCSI